MCIWLVKNQDKKKPEVILLCWQVAVNRFTHASICLGLEKKAHTLITKPSKICNCLYWVIFHTNNVRCTIMSALFVIRIIYNEWISIIMMLAMFLVAIDCAVIFPESFIYVILNERILMLRSINQAHIFLGSLDK